MKAVKTERNGNNKNSSRMVVIGWLVSALSLVGGCSAAGKEKEVDTRELWREGAGSRLEVQGKRVVEVVAERYEVMEDETVRDRETGLIWSQEGPSGVNWE